MADKPLFAPPAPKAKKEKPFKPFSVKALNFSTKELAADFVERLESSPVEKGSDLEVLIAYITVKAGL